LSMLETATRVERASSDVGNRRSSFELRGPGRTDPRARVRASPIGRVERLRWLESVGWVEFLRDPTKAAAGRWVSKGSTQPTANGHQNGQGGWIRTTGLLLPR